MTSVHLSECSICLEDVSAFISCGCESIFCHPCTRQALLSTTADPHCPNCRKAWNRDFLYDTLGSDFINTTYRDHRRNTLLETQKALLPQTMISLSQTMQREQFIATNKQLKQDLEIIIDQLKTHHAELLHKIKHIRTQLKKLSYPSSEFDTLKITLNNEKSTLSKIYNDLQSAINKKREVQQALLHNHLHPLDTTPSTPKIICSCPHPQCRGFITSNHKCGLCNNKICRDCREPLLAEHKCDPDTIETVKLLKQDTKPCPKCATPINKLDGCDQMWCPQCKVAFSWKKGTIETGYVHNPHYFEYMRRTGQHIQRNPLDLPTQGQCRAPTVQRANDTLREILFRYSSFMKTSDFNIIKNINADYNHLLEILSSYNDRVHRMTQQEDLRIKYLKKEISQLQLAETLVRRDKLREKCTVIRDIIQIISSVATETICGLANIKFKEIIDQAQQLSLSNPKYLQYIQNKLIHHPTNPTLVQIDYELHDLRGHYIDTHFEDGLRYVHIDTPIKFRPSPRQLKLQIDINCQNIFDFYSLYTKQMDTVIDYANEQFIKIAKNYNMKSPFIVSSNYLPIKNTLYSYKELLLIQHYNLQYRLQPDHIPYIIKHSFELITHPPSPRTL